MLAVIFTARISMGFQFQSIASVATFIVDDLHMSYAQVGLLMGLYMIPGVLIALPSGWLVQRFSALAVASGGLALMMAAPRPSRAPTGSPSPRRGGSSVAREASCSTWRSPRWSPTGSRGGSSPPRWA